MSFNSFDISASGLYAQRLKMDTIASNMANINTTRKPDGSPGAYVRKDVAFAAAYDDVSKRPDLPMGGTEPGYNNASGNMLFKASIEFNTTEVATGVKVAAVTEDKNPYKMVFEPSHPDANAEGFVQMPNINVVSEMVDMMTASRAYDANATSIDTTKSMINSAMRIIS